MAHRNRWFTELKNWWIFPWRTVTNNQMENANDMGYNLFSDDPDDWGQESLSQNGSKCAAVWAPWTNDFSES
jgi:hypothetical protein